LKISRTFLNSHFRWSYKK